MLKKTIALVLLLSLLLGATAMAEVTNRDMQLMGGVVVTNSTDAFFFCPMESGITGHWGLYALSSVAEGPILDIKNGYPARLVHADEENVYFLGYTDAGRTVHTLYSVNIATGENAELVTNISSAFVGESDVILFVKADELYTLYSYNITKRQETKIKDMSASNKKIYDAGIYNGGTYFITKADSGGAEDGYEYHESSGKATNLDKPSPAVYTGLLYEGYRLYSANREGDPQIYAMRIGNKKSERIGTSYNVSLTNPRFGNMMYAYDSDKGELVALPLDASAAKSLALDTGIVSRLVLGGSKDELLLLGNDEVYSIKPDLSGQTKLFDFDTGTGGQLWTVVAPAKDAILLMGYGQETFTHQNSMLPTAVYVIDRATGEQLFGFPEWDPENPTVEDRPEAIGDIPRDDAGEEGEGAGTYFIWDDAEG